MASMANFASPENSPTLRNGTKSRALSPTATQGRGTPSAIVTTPNGRFWMGKSGWPLAEETQLLRSGSWVSSNVSIISLTSAYGVLAGLSCPGFRR